MNRRKFIAAVGALGAFIIAPWKSAPKSPWPAAPLAASLENHVTSSRTLFVSSEGNFPHPGHNNHRTLNAAYGACKPGDRICVLPGHIETIVDGAPLMIPDNTHFI